MRTGGVAHLLPRALSRRCGGRRSRAIQFFAGATIRNPQTPLSNLRYGLIAEGSQIRTSLPRRTERDGNLLCS